MNTRDRKILEEMNKCGLVILCKKTGEIDFMANDHDMKYIDGSFQKLVSLLLTKSFTTGNKTFDEMIKNECFDILDDLVNKHNMKSKAW